MGVQIVDLSGLPDTAVLVKNFIYISATPPDSGKSNVRSHTVTVADGYLTANGAFNGPREVRLSSPSLRIRRLRHMPDPSSRCTSTTPTFETTHCSAPRSIPPGSVHRYVHDKANPVIITKINYTGSGTHNAWRSMDGKYVFTTDEIGTTHHNMKVWDISNLPA